MRVTTLKGVRPRDLPTEDKPRRQFRPRLTELKVGANGFELLTGCRQTDIAAFVFSLPVATGEHPGMGNNRSTSYCAQESSEPTGMVRVSMAQDNPVNPVRINSQYRQVVQQGAAATGIKQPSFPADLDQTGKSMLTEYGHRLADRIFTDNRETN